MFPAISYIVYLKVFGIAFPDALSFAPEIRSDQIADRCLFSNAYAYV